MRAVVTIVAALAAVPALAQKPWEERPDLRLPAPVELPAVPAMNPFFRPLVAPPAVLSSPLLDKFSLKMTAEAAIYVDAAGACRRVVFTALPLPGLAEDLGEDIADARFSPGRVLGANASTWLTVAVDLEGRVYKGTVVAVGAAAPDPRTPDVPDAPPAPVPTVADKQLAATPVEKLDQAPGVRRFRARIGSHAWRQPVRFLADVGPSGRCERVVFLSCPEGLRPWLVASLANWSFRPGHDRAGPVDAWVTVTGEVEIDLSTLRADTVRLIPRSSYPGEVAEPGVDPPPGG